MAIAVFTNKDGLEFVKPTFNQMTLRIFCCYLLHFGNYREVSDSYKRMKFVRRFPERFDPEYVIAAFMLTFYQFTSGILVEAVCMLYLTRQKNLV